VKVPVQVGATSKKKGWKKRGEKTVSLWNTTVKASLVKRLLEEPAEKNRSKVHGSQDRRSESSSLTNRSLLSFVF